MEKTATRAPRRGRTLERRRKKEGLIFLTPWLVGTALFFLFPVGYSLLISFSKIVKVSTMSMDFTGIKHYAEALQSTEFLGKLWEVMQKTLLNTPLIIVFSLFIAIILNKKIKFRGFFRAIFFLPVLLGTGFVMQELFNDNIQANAMQVASRVLLPDQVVLYLGQEVTDVVRSFLNQLTTVFWKSGVQIVIFLAGLQKIPSSLYESAQIDSATEWEMMWSITLPLITPMILLNAVYTFVDFFTDAENPIIQYLLTQMFSMAKFEFAAATGWIYFFVIFVLLGLVFLILRPFVKNASY